MLTQEAFDKIYKELDFEKIELKNFNFIDEVEEDGKTFKENFEAILNETNGLNSFYTKKIEEVENQKKLKIKLKNQKKERLNLIVLNMKILLMISILKNFQIQELYQKEI